MNEKINILNIELYQTSAKAAMQKVVQYMESDSINTVEIITMDMLLKGKDMPGWKEAVESLNLVLPGETEILEAAGVREKTLLRDTAGQVFLKMFLRYIQRNKKMCIRDRCTGAGRRGQCTPSGSPGSGRPHQTLAFTGAGGG